MNTDIYDSINSKEAMHILRHAIFLDYLLRSAVVRVLTSKSEGRQHYPEQKSSKSMRLIETGPSCHL